jgi:hypothetical protein
MKPNEVVTADEWADFVSDYRTYQTEPRADLMLSKLPNGAVIAMVTYKPEGKKYVIRRATAEKYPEFKRERQ